MFTAYFLGAGNNHLHYGFQSGTGRLAIRSQIKQTSCLLLKYKNV